MWCNINLVNNIIKCQQSAEPHSEIFSPSKKQTYSHTMIQLILITNSDLPVLYCFKTKGISKYKKVSKDKKEQLIKLILKEGQSIIEVQSPINLVRSKARHQLLHGQEHYPEPQKTQDQRQRTRHQRLREQ